MSVEICGTPRLKGKFYIRCGCSIQVCLTFESAGRLGSKAGLFCTVSVGKSEFVVFIICGMCGLKCYMSMFALKDSGMSAVRCLSIDSTIRRHVVRIM